MASHPIRIGNVRRITVLGWSERAEERLLLVIVQRQDGGSVEWFVTGKCVACLVPTPQQPHAPAEVLRIVERSLSLGRRAYLRSLAGPAYRAEYP